LPIRKNRPGNLQNLKKKERKMTERQKLSVDFDSLFPGDTLEIGTSSVLIQPLGLEQIILLSKRLKSIGKVLSEEGITWDNYADRTSMFKISVIVLDSFPDVLEEVSNIDIGDLKRLPLAQIVRILNKVIEVNLKSRDDLIKNFKSLTEQLVNQTDLAPKKK